MTIKLDKLVSALAALTISIASFVAVTDVQAKARDELDLSRETRCEGRAYGPSHHPARKRRSIECTPDQASDEATERKSAPVPSSPLTLRNPRGE